MFNLHSVSVIIPDPKYQEKKLIIEVVTSSYLCLFDYTIIAVRCKYDCLKAEQDKGMKQIR